MATEATETTAEAGAVPDGPPSATEALTSAAIKRAVRLRDGWRCRKCGMSQEEHRRIYGKALEVHRLTPGSPYTIAGCETRCVPCHGPEPKSPPKRKAYVTVFVDEATALRWDAYRMHAGKKANRQLADLLARFFHEQLGMPS